MCENFRFFVLKKPQDAMPIVIEAGCGRWDCDQCSLYLRDKWRSHLKKRILAMPGQWWFLTLTAHSKKRTAAQSIANLRRLLDLLLKRMRRLFGRIDYVRVFEKHRSGAFHAHMVLRGVSPFVAVRRTKKRTIFSPLDVRDQKAGAWTFKTWLAKASYSLKAGYSVAAKPIANTAQIVGYVTKYMTKSAQMFEIKGLRRVQCSQSIGSPNKRGSGDWLPIGRVYALDVNYGRFRDVTNKLIITAAYWREHTVYPDESEQPI